MNDMTTYMREVFVSVDFVDRYKKLCIEYNDFANSMRGNNKALYLEILKSIDSSVNYIAKDHFFIIAYKTSTGSIDLGLSLKDGLVEAFFFYIENGERIEPTRFDFVAASLDPTFNRKQYNLPKYTSESELSSIVSAIYRIYIDLREAFIHIKG